MVSQREEEDATFAPCPPISPRFQGRMPLDRLELFNFKSYPGKQTINFASPFTCIIGPNGGGKSNLMDAISFVLGVRSSSLRSAALKDLVWRSGKGKDDTDGEEEEEEAEGEGEGKGDGDGERNAWVMAVYKDEGQGGKEWRFQRRLAHSFGSVLFIFSFGRQGFEGSRASADSRFVSTQHSVSANGSSDYKLNGKVVTYKKYNDTLEGFNILVKAKNFLVFQVRPPPPPPSSPD